MIACDAPDPQLGVAIRLSSYLDCQARALGENGFLALIGGPLQAGLLSGLITIFTALIGYRLLLGRVPSLRDGIGWAVRLGVVLALVTGWPAFQTLIYRVAVDGPGEVAGVLLPASDLPAEDLEGRVQAAYDTMRLGPGSALIAQQDADAGAAPGKAPPPAVPLQQRSGAPGLLAFPQTASAFAVSTAGMVGAFRIAIGFLLAVGPLAILGLLFDATLGLFSGWVRALAGAAFALTAAIVVTAIELVVVEGELGHMQVYARGGVADVVDAQGLTTIVLLFAVVMLVTVLLAGRVAGAFRLPLPERASENREQSSASWGSSHALASPQITAPATQPPGVRSATAQPRAAAVADALSTRLRREEALAAAGLGVAAATRSRGAVISLEGTRVEQGAATSPLGVSGRRTQPRRTRSSAARDGTA